MQGGTVIITPEGALNIDFVGHTDQGARGQAKVRHAADLFVAQFGLMYPTDDDASRNIMQGKGA